MMFKSYEALKEISDGSLKFSRFRMFLNRKHNATIDDSKDVMFWGYVIGWTMVLVAAVALSSC